MGNHRATRADRRRSSVARPTAGGSRIASRSTERAATAPALAVSPVVPVVESAPVEAVARAVAAPAPSRPEAARAQSGHRARRSEHADFTPGPVGTPGGRRRAARPVNPFLRVLPSAPILVGVTALAISTGGAVAAAQPSLVNQVTGAAGAGAAASSLGAKVGAAQSRNREPAVSRSGGRATAATDGAAAADTELVEEAEELAQERSESLQVLTRKAAAQSKRIEENQWVLPLASYSITARFGQYGLWASYHTGLDFNGNTGDPIMAVANGTITEVGYDGAYGNKTVLTLEDGTEIWFCHQTSMYVSPGDTVRAGEVIGTVGATGNVTGSHLHLEVRPGGGDPVDPAAAFAAQGITP